ncbi:GspH/FimT family pseudopilin [Variovorax sp. RA8]|uniref:GspH/FimT family pseudopilin n=1 Tax=Variovorax sp. (strain JCM 16519 / RA8) TaxID=662548 RepID=UPI000AD46218|nr:GspH/FimT family pseudopilin [Variovorax sp. RA8]
MEQLLERLGDEEGTDVLMRRPGHVAGFTLIELMVTIVLLAILLALGFPSMTTWIRNSKIRTVADSLQNGLRLAQAEALRRSRQTVFSLTNSTSPATSLTAVANGRNWSINTVQLLTDETPQFVEAGVLSSVGNDVQITGPVSICFNSLGRLVANATPGPTGANCAAAAASYNITLTGADRPLRVLVSLGGQVRMCDPARNVSTSPDGCP